jgi:multidrug efflux pump subunit AcrA (membrane-fusion protein)
VSHKNYAITVFSVLITALGGVLAGCTNDRRAETAPPEMVSNISVIVVQKTTVPGRLEAVGTVRAVQTSQVSSQMMGNIVEMRSRAERPCTGDYQ